jgi:hypothetical protein
VESIMLEKGRGSGEVSLWRTSVRERASLT